MSKIYETFCPCKKVKELKQYIDIVLLSFRFNFYFNFKKLYIATAKSYQHDILTITIITKNLFRGGRGSIKCNFFVCFLLQNENEQCLASLGAGGYDWPCWPIKSLFLIESRPLLESNALCRQLLVVLQRCNYKQLIFKIKKQQDRAQISHVSYW